MAPPPATPFIQGSSTPSAKPVAITASTQSPPAASTSVPISAARRAWAATMPPLETMAGLRNCWPLEKRSDMLLSSALVAGRPVKPPSTKTSRERHASPHRLPDLRFRRHERHDRQRTDLADPDLPRRVRRDRCAPHPRASGEIPHLSNLLHPRRGDRHLSG